MVHSSACEEYAPGFLRLEQWNLLPSGHFDLAILHIKAGRRHSSRGVGGIVRNRAIAPGIAMAALHGAGRRRGNGTQFGDFAFEPRYRALRQAHRVEPGNDIKVAACPIA